MVYRQDTPQLAKRGKAVCSYCGKKTFVNYIYPDGTPVADGVCGKCDRADNCGIHYPPREYFKDKGSLRTPREIRFQPPRKQPIVTVPSYIEPSSLLDTMKEHERNPFVKFLHSYLDRDATAEVVQDNVERYAVGTSSKYNGSAIFWQIDQFGRIRTGQIMGYDPTTGKRNHHQSNWFHSVRQEDYPDFKLQQCYFGSHLINEIKEDNEVEPYIYLFESPKAAVIMAISLMWGGGRKMAIPMATCGCGNPYDKIQVLKNRKVVLFPDCGKFEEWKSKGEELKGFCKEVWISTSMERNLHPYEIGCEINDGDGFDDLILRYMAAGKPIWELLETSFGYQGQWKLV